ncbi:MAG: 5-methyltetrahydropteroyltriglutamate--homocysteine S-methyltransferase [Arcobacter sp.]|nr:MAG: 5-methyltetrahydropteroyltriglutamate--homocysteine S-methyltransferase [Arcobacter sp.]
MSKNYLIGFPRIGENRELKRALESYWANKTTYNDVLEVASSLKEKHWKEQNAAGICYIPSNDFSLYDNILDTSILLNVIPKRFEALENEELYFALARGTKEAQACEMTKWFNTNYHYIVPELSKDTKFKLNSKKVVDEFKEAKALGIKTKINLTGIITYLGLSKSVDNEDVYLNVNKVLDLYVELLKELDTLDDNLVIQFDEPIFVKDLDSKVLSLIKPIYDTLSKVSKNIKIVVSTYFEHSNEASKILLTTPIWALSLDFIYGLTNLEILEEFKASNKVLIAGVIDGRNVFKSDFNEKVKLLNTIKTYIKEENLLISTSCSLLHVPYTLDLEDKLNSEVKECLAFAREKLNEIRLLSIICFNKRLNQKDQEEIIKNKEISENRKKSSQINNKDIQKELDSLTLLERVGAYEERIKVQKAFFKYNDLATTTIGSFPQTPEVRASRLAYKRKEISKEEYENDMKQYIKDCIAFQEEVGLEILVHGEPERNDMVEYFGEQLDGFAFSQYAWVQSYGSRCVKPPLIYGDVSRPSAMTVSWSTYAQEQTQKIVKGMLTGPVTILNWSFVRDDIPRSEVSKQIALALSYEVDDLQKAGIKMIQVDEAAFKEGYPLRVKNIKEYESWALESFKLAVSKAQKDTQIHTHMCYSQFNDIITTIEEMDADVITIETSRSGNKLLQIFKEVGYKQEVGPGVYDIHSPRVPSVEEIVKQINLLKEVLPVTQLWINPDCGLKTRKWPEVKQSLKNLVQAVEIVRAQKSA